MTDLNIQISEGVRITSGDIPVVRFQGERMMYIDVRDIERFIERNKTIYD